MNSSTKHLWKNSACLIILGKYLPTIPPTTITTKSSSPQIYDPSFSVPSNFKCLVFKRPQNATFASNAIVFPGGVCEPSDDAQQWIDYYLKTFDISQIKFNDITNVNGTREFIFHKNDDNHLAREISLRITAIRETFEELGILFCKTKEQFKDTSSIYGSVYEDIDDVKHWQTAVHNDSTKFFELCKTYSIAPDLWTLYEWSSWITPVFMPKRYDTAFFIVALPNVSPKVYPESTEVTEYMWESPENLLELHQKIKIWLAPPQYYEMSRLNAIKNIDNMMEFAKKRNNKGITSFFPVHYVLSNGITTTFKGDDFYPNSINIKELTEPNVDEKKYNKLTMQEFRKLAKNLHRADYNDTVDWLSTDIHINIKPYDDHLAPVTKITSKL